jgi:hypothetical protein
MDQRESSLELGPRLGRTSGGRRTGETRSAGQRQAPTTGVISKPGTDVAPICSFRNARRNDGLDPGGLTSEQFRPSRMAVENQNAAGRRFTFPTKVAEFE